MKNSHRLPGFTLIELLVVIAIVGILSALILTQVSNARSQARDSQRISGVQSLQQALELYFDSKGYYPYSFNGCGTSGILPVASWENSDQCMQNGYWIRDASTGNNSALAPYLAADPVDPTPKPATFGTSWLHVGTWYYFASGHENPPNKQPDYYAIEYTLENPNLRLEQNDGITLPDGTKIYYPDNNPPTNSTPPNIVAAYSHHP